LEETLRKLIPILILVLACSKQESRGASTVDRTSAAPIMAADSAQARVAESASPAMPRMIVRTADVKIVVADTAKSIEAITKSAEAAGGYVSGSNIWRDGELLRAKLTLRVPADKLTATLAAIRNVAKRVENETVASEDVSQEFVDLESRVRNLEATEAELRELLTVARVSSKKAADVLEVHAQLSVVRGEIEQARGRMRYLSQVTSMSAISLEVMPDAIAKPVVEPGWRPLVVARDASRALIALLQGVGTGTIWFLIYFVPVLGMLSLLIAALVKLSRRVRPREAHE
jgi:hypothetical protein